MTKEIHDINTRALDFVVELIEYIFEYPDDDYMTMECLCRKLHKHGLIDKKDGYYLVADDTLRKTEPQTFDKPTKCLGCLYSDLDKAFHPCASCENFSKYVGEVSGKTEQPEKSE